MKKKLSVGSIWIFLGVVFFPPPGLSIVMEESLDSCLYHLKRYRIEALKRQTDQQNHPYLKTLLIAEANYLDSGAWPDSGLVLKEHQDKKIRVVAQFLYANYLRRSAIAPDSTIYRLYFDAFNTAEMLSDTVLLNLILPEINHFYFRNGEEMDQFGEYLHHSQRYARDSIDLFWYYYYSIGREMKLMEREEAVEDTIRMNGLILEMERHAPSSFFKAYGFQQKAIYYDVFRQQKEKALELYRRAKELYQSIPYYYAQKGVPGMRFNEAILQYETGQYREALSYFMQHQREEQNMVYQIYGNEWIYKCYEGMGQMDSAYFYFKKMTALKEEVDRSGTALQVNKIEFNYNLEQKEKELSRVLAESSKQKGRSQTYLIGILIFAGLSLIAYYLFRKQRKQTDLLEEEKSETIVKLEELKNIVTKDFILLNDKTKVYVSELVYIKSDDHYLHIFLQGGKSVFVRGSLKAMNKKLPPNFKKSHRSYIVNENYISKIHSSSIVLTEGSIIPISKTYKSNFL